MNARDLFGGVSFDDAQLSMSNALTRAAHGLTLAEKRLVAACIARSDQMPAINAITPSAWTIRVTAAEYAAMYGVSMDTAYDQLKAAGESLYERKIRYIVPTKRGPEVSRVRWVGRATYHDGEGYVELAWFHETAPHLFGLRRDFTSYKLRHATALQSRYSWRLYELLQSWADTGIYSPTIEEFAHAMDVPESFARDFKEIRRRAIEKPVAELQEKCHMKIKWEAQRAGRKVIGLTFEFNFVTPLLPGIEP